MTMMMKAGSHPLRFLSAWFPAVASGVLAGCSFGIASGLAWLPWVALAPLCWSLWIHPLPGSPQGRALRCFLLGWVAGTVSFLISLFWITTVTVLGWILLCAVLGVYHGLWALYAGLVLRPLGETPDPARSWLGSLRNLTVCFLAAAGWTGVEWLRGILFTGFGWNSLGVALGSILPLAQIASITGTSGLTFLCVLGGAVLAVTVERLRREIVGGRTRPHLDFFGVVFLIVLCFSWGLTRMNKPAGPVIPLRVAGLQGNIPVYDYWDPKCEERIMETYRDLTRRALGSSPDLIVWPEAATPRPLLLDEILFDQVRDLASGTPADFLIGSIHYTRDPRGDFNAAILLTDHASASEIYNKVHLVPFGEFVPFRKALPLLSRIVGDRVPYDFDPGKGPALLRMHARPVLLGPLICFEDTLGDQTRRTAALGAQLLVTLTNDGWFEHSPATREHLANARLRTIETGLPMIRVADTGVSCLIDSRGRIRERLAGPGGDTFIQGILDVTVDVPVTPSPTFYTRNGDLFAKACVALTVACLFVALRRRLV